MIQTHKDFDNAIGTQRGVARSTLLLINTSGALVTAPGVENHLLSTRRPQSNRETHRETHRHQILFNTVCDERGVWVRRALRIQRRKNAEKAGSTLDLDLAGVLEM